MPKPLQTRNLARTPHADHSSKSKSWCNYQQVGGGLQGSILVDYREINYDKTLIGWKGSKKINEIKDVASYG